MAATDGTSLRCSLAFRDLGNITLTMLGKDYKDITELDLSNNTINDFRFLLELPHLHTLILDRNSLTSHVKFPELTGLRVLWVNHNKIENLGVFIGTVSKCFPGLHYLSMMNNTAAPSYFNGGSYILFKDYRHYVISQLPDIRCLDDKVVSAAEMKEAHRIYSTIKAKSSSQNEEHEEKKSPHHHDRN